MTCAAIEASHNSGRKCRDGTLRAGETIRGETAARCAGISESFSQSLLPSVSPGICPGCRLPDLPRSLLGFQSWMVKQVGVWFGDAGAKHPGGSSSTPGISGLWKLKREGVLLPVAAWSCKMNSKCSLKNNKLQTLPCIYIFHTQELKVLSVRSHSLAVYKKITERSYEVSPKSLLWTTKPALFMRWWCAFVRRNVKHQPKPKKPHWGTRSAGLDCTTAVTPLGCRAGTLSGQCFPKRMPQRQPDLHEKAGGKQC